MSAKTRRDRKRKREKGLFGNSKINQKDKTDRIEISNFRDD